MKGKRFTEEQIIAVLKEAVPFSTQWMRIREPNGMAP
jgi:hypothetical protein